MKRYNFIADPIIFVEDANGQTIAYDEFIDFISARIKELEDEMDNEDSIYSEASCRFRIDELKRLLK